MNYSLTKTDIAKEKEKSENGWIIAETILPEISGNEAYPDERQHRPCHFGRGGENYVISDFSGCRHEKKVKSKI